MVPLVAVVLGERDPGVDARLARRDRHVARVRDEDRALHQRGAGARIGEPRELVEHLGQLVAALAARDVDDHVRVPPLRERLLEHGLAGAEPARDRRGAASGEREERVDRPLSRDERRVEREPAGGGAGGAHGPAREHRQRLAVDPDDRLVDARTTGADLRDRAGDAGRDEDAVRERNRLLRRCRARLRADPLTGGDGGLEFPASLPVERRRRDAARDHRRPPRVLAGAGEHGQRALRPVEDRAEQTRAELDLERLAGVEHRLSRDQPGRVLVDLDHRVARRRGGSPRPAGARVRPGRRCTGASRAGPSPRLPGRRRRGSGRWPPWLPGPRSLSRSRRVVSVVEGDLVADRLPEDPQVLRAPLGFGVRPFAARERDDERRDERVDPALQRSIELLKKGSWTATTSPSPPRSSSSCRLSAASATEPIALRGDAGQPVARLELGRRQDDQPSHRPPQGTISCARRAAAGSPPAAPSPSSRRFRTSFSSATV